MKDSAVYWTERVSGCWRVTQSPSVSAIKYFTVLRQLTTTKNKRKKGSSLESGLWVKVKRKLKTKTKTKTRKNSVPELDLSSQFSWNNDTIDQTSASLTCRDAGLVSPGYCWPVVQPGVEHVITLNDLHCSCTPSAGPLHYSDLHQIFQHRFKHSL